MTPGTLSLTGNSPSDDERSKIVEDITATTTADVIRATFTHITTT
jgi:hypothetical protein